MSDRCDLLICAPQKELRVLARIPPINKSVVAHVILARGPIILSVPAASSPRYR
jgi:hypothetical protein